MENIKETLGPWLEEGINKRHNIVCTCVCVCVIKPGSIWDRKEDMAKKAKERKIQKENKLALWSPRIIFEHYHALCFVLMKEQNTETHC